MCILEPFQLLNIHKNAQKTDNTVSYFYNIYIFEENALHTSLVFVHFTK